MDEDLDLDFGDLDFGLDLKTDVVRLEIDAVVANLDVNNRQVFCIDRESQQLENLIPYPPPVGTCYKMLSGKNGFSSIAIIDYIARREVIEEMYVSTFRIGQKQMEVLDELAGRIKSAHFITSSLQGREDEKDKYDYGKYCRAVCDKYGWGYHPHNNHSKVFLMRTAQNYYVCETSSNLNENPKLEQYSFENNKDVYEFYEKMFLAILKKIKKS